LAKRFTDTDKWKRTWFCGLSTQAKVCWFYLLDQCDHRGVWYANFKLMSAQVEFKVTQDKFEEWFGDKIRRFDDDKYFIPSFVEFQYGELNPSNNAHKSIISLIETLKNTAPQEPLNRGSIGAQDKDKDKDKESVLRSVDEKISEKDLDPIYQQYPRKEGKTRGYAVLLKDCKRSELEFLAIAVNNYAEAASNTEPKYIKHFSTFAKEWRDWIEHYAKDAVDSGWKKFLSEEPDGAA
jgi:hypothetical protein